ncbi:MAG: hypothetical protein KDC53_18925, partial [Saprospiraceae bacterium]|nr:hypothetical protein [Saprospiraceae bacterium]
MKHLLFISLLMTVNQLYAQDLIRLSPYGKENCYEFMTQGYRGNVVSVIAEDGTHYKIKMNKLEQIEWVVDDPSEALYSMLDSGLLIGAYSKENKIYINCREKNGDLRWVKSEDGGAYSFDIIEMNDQQFVLAAGDFYKTSLLCMDLVGNVIWKTSFRTSMHLANSGDVIFTNGQGILVLGEKLEARDSLYFTQLDNNGQVLWQKRKYFITQEGGIVIYQDDDGGFIIYDPDTYSEVNDYSSTLRIVKLDKDLQEVDRKEYPVDYPCGLIPFTAFPYVDQILPYYDSLIYSVGSYSDEEDELLIYCPGIENCYNRPVRFELLNSFECRPSTFVGNYLMKQRGTNDFIVAFARQDEDGLYSRFCNFDLDFINY